MREYEDLHGLQPLPIRMVRTRIFRRGKGWISGLNLTLGQLNEPIVAQVGACEEQIVFGIGIGNSVRIGKRPKTQTVHCRSGEGI